MYFKICLQCLMLNVMCVVGTVTQVLKIPQGKLRGFQVPFSGQHKYFGIPYAVAERFQPPQPAPKWDGILNAVHPISTCPQAVSYLILGKENCLHLDVYTPGHVKPGLKLSVMVFIHGGAYYHGAKYHYDPEFLVTHDVIVVIPNYRLGILGFLCLNGTSNLGLKDQVAALKWVKDNIKFFGGDPDNVTMFGQSAGASAVGMHLLTNSSKNLFHKAILQSGSPLAPWAFNIETTTQPVEDAMKLGAKTDNIEEVYKTLLKANLFHLLVVTKDTSINTKHFKYSPCVDNDFFTDTPYNILKSKNYNQVPVIIGTANNEGLLFYGLHNTKTLKDFNENFNEKLSEVFDWCSDEEKEIISNNIRSHYFSNRDINETLMNDLVDYYSDWLSYSTALAFTNILSYTSSKPVYSYIFSYEGERNYGKFAFTPGTKSKGASHTDDIFYLFKPAGINLVLTSADKIMIRRMSILWTNFAKTGNPTPVTSRLLPTLWSPITHNNKKVLEIDRTMKMITVPKHLQGTFFHKLLCEYGQSGYVPCDSLRNCNTNSSLSSS